MFTIGSCQTVQAIFSGSDKQDLSNDSDYPLDSLTHKHLDDALVDSLSLDANLVVEDLDILQIDTLFILEKTKCFDSCPNYSLTFLSNGEVYLKAIDNLFIQGFYQCSIDGLKMDAITDLSKKFMESAFASKYPTDGIFLEGLPKSILVGQSGQLKKEVICQYDCPDEINHLTQYLEQIIPTLDWQKIRL